jgi:hypothetical protein
MLEGLLAYGFLSLVLFLPAYLSGWLLLRVFTRYEVESLKAWLARTHTDRKNAGPSRFLKYATPSGDGVTAEYAVQVGCLFWLLVLVLLPLTIWFLYSAFGPSAAAAR